MSKMPNGGIGPLPPRLADFLGSAYYTLTIVVVLLGLVSFVLSLKWRVDELEGRNAEHPTKHELATVATKVDDQLVNIERRLEDFDVHGTRALADRMTLVEQRNHSEDDRIQELIRRMNDLQVSINGLNNQLPVIVDRQNSVLNNVRELQQRVWGNSGKERGEIPPILQVPHGPH